MASKNRVIQSILLTVYIATISAFSPSHPSASSTVTSLAASYISRRSVSVISQLATSSLALSPRSFHSRRALTLAMVSGNNNSSTKDGVVSEARTAGLTTPPVARREEDRVVLAGKPPSEDAPIRQSETSSNKLMDPPRAISDPYGWIRDEARTNQAVLDHLKVENAYTEGITSHLKDLRTSLYDEMVANIQETDYTTPTPKDGKYWYYTRTCKGKSYTMYCRAPIPDSSTSLIPKVEWDGTAESPILPGEEVYLDVNALAENKKYCSVSSPVFDPTSQEMLAYTVDFTGDEIYSLCVQNTVTGEVIDQDEKLECYGRVVWGSEKEKCDEVYYLKMDDAQRPFQVYRRNIFDKEKEDELLFEDVDDLYWVSISKSSDKKYLFIESSSSETSEVHYLDLQDPDAKLKCVATRRKKVLYDVEHWDGNWLITSNVDETPNMRLMMSKVGEETAKEWKDVTLAETEDKLFDGGYDRALDGIDTFKDYTVASGREGGIPRVWVMKMSNIDEVKFETFTKLEFAESAYDAGVGGNADYETKNLVLWYDSLITPPQSIRISMDDPNNMETRIVLKEKTVPGYKKEEFGCERLTVTARDGKTEIPLSIVYSKDVMEKHVSSGSTVPVHLYGYGSYGACCEADFNAQRLPLLKRGIVYVCAHVRGGGEMGRQWYEEPNGAKYLCKKNTFNDFCDVAKWLLEERKLTSAEQLSCEGRSAGGLLIGASVNQAPELFRVAILGVPFVDVACTMVDSTIPLTCGEWEEWGNPNEEKFFDYMMEYSPMNNVKKGAKYPSCLLTGGLHDPRVQYWEPAKFAAELRHGHDEKTSGPICLKIDMTAGHFSASDRYKYLSELAFDYAFLIDQLGLHSDD